MQWSECTTERFSLGLGAYYKNKIIGLSRSPFDPIRSNYVTFSINEEVEGVAGPLSQKRPVITVARGTLQSASYSLFILANPGFAPVRFLGHIGTSK